MKQELSSKEISLIIALWIINLTIIYISMNWIVAIVSITCCYYLSKSIIFRKEKKWK